MGVWDSLWNCQTGIVRLELSELPNAMKTHLGGDPKREPAQDSTKNTNVLIW